MLCVGACCAWLGLAVPTKWLRCLVWAVVLAGGVGWAELRQAVHQVERGLGVGGLGGQKLPELAALGAMHRGGCAVPCRAGLAQFPRTLRGHDVLVVLSGGD